MENKGIIVFGAAGLVGRYLYSFLKEQNKKVIGTDIAKRPDLIYFDITKSNLDKLPLEGIGYGVVCAAVTKLDVCKNNPELSYSVNVEGMKKIIAELTRRSIVPVFFSSASVFDGVEGGYKEEGERNPTSVYGKQKVEVEDFITAKIKDYLIVRPGKVFGVRKGEGVLFTEWLDKYKAGEIIKLADDEQLSIIYAGDVAKALSLLIGKNARGLWHINPPKYYSRFEMASAFFSYLGITDAKIVRCSIDDFDFSEKRNKNTYLDTSKFIKETKFEFTPFEKCYEMIKQNCLSD